MPVQTVVIRVTQDSSELVKLVDHLEKLGVIDKQNAKQFRDSERAFNQGQRNAQSNIRRTNQEMGNTGRSIGILDRQFRNLGTTIASVFAVRQIVSFTKSIIDARAQVEYTQVAFETLLGSTTKAKKLLKEMAEFAARTPFTIPEVEEAGKQLLAYGFQAKELIETTKRLGNVSAALKIPLNDLIYLYGTTRIQSRLMTKDLNQFLGRGIDLIPSLARQFGIAESSVHAFAETGGIGFENVKIAIEEMTNEGGMFFNLMDKQSKTTGGQLSNLEDSFLDLKRAIGEELAPVISDVIASLRRFLSNIDGKDVVRFGKFILLAVQALVSYKLAARAASLATSFLSKTVASAGLAGVGLASNFAKAIPVIGTIISVVGLAKTAFGLFSQKTRDLTEDQKELEQQLKETREELERQTKTLSNVTTASLKDLKEVEAALTQSLEELSKERVRTSINVQRVTQQDDTGDLFSVDEQGKMTPNVRNSFPIVNVTPVSDAEVEKAYQLSLKSITDKLKQVQDEIAKRSVELGGGGKDKKSEAQKAAEKQAEFEAKQFNDFIELLFDKDNAEREISDESLKRAKLRNREELTDSDAIRLADLQAEQRHLENILELNILAGEKLLDVELQLADKKQEIRDLEIQRIAEQKAKEAKIREDDERKALELLRRRADITQQISSNLASILIYNERARINEIVRGGATIEEAEKQVAEERAKQAQQLFKGTIDLIIKELQAVLQAAIFESFAKAVATGVPLPIALAQASVKTIALNAAFATASAAVNSLTFHEGTDYVPGQGGQGLRRDESYAKLQQGEGVVKTSMNLKYKGLVKALNEDSALDWFLSQPSMKSSDLKTLRAESATSSIVQQMMGGRFSDENINRYLKRGMKQDRENTHYLASVIKQATSSNPWGVKR